MAEAHMSLEMEIGRGFGGKYITDEAIALTSLAFHIGHIKDLRLPLNGN